MPHIHLINPNTTASMTQQMCQDALKVASAQTTITAITPSSGPKSIESHFDEVIAGVGVCDAIRQGDKAGADGFIIACFGDPAIWAARELTDKPVLGIAQAAFMMASMVATRFAVVTSMQRTVIMAKHLLTMYGMSDLCSAVLAVDMPVLSLESCVATKAIIEQSVYARDHTGAGAIVLGCGGMSHVRADIEQAIGIPVIDGVASSVKLLEAMIGLGITTSKQGDLAYPIAKTFMGEFSRFSDGS